MPALCQTRPCRHTSGFMVPLVTIRTIRKIDCIQERRSRLIEYMVGHLVEDELESYAMGTAGPATTWIQAHLARCGACAGRYRETRAFVDAMRSASTMCRLSQGRGDGRASDPALVVLQP